MSAVIIVNIDNMTDDEFKQAWDLIILNNITASNFEDPIKCTRSIEIELGKNQHTCNTLDGTLGYINKHIVNK